MAMNGDFFAEKEHVRTEMKQRLEALAEDRVLAKKVKERVIETAVCSVFCYSAGFVDWTGAKRYLQDVDPSIQVLYPTKVSLQPEMGELRQSMSAF